MEKLGHINLVERGSYDYVSSNFPAEGCPFIPLYTCAEDIAESHCKDEWDAVFIPTMKTPCLWMYDEDEQEWCKHYDDGCYFPVTESDIKKWVDFIMKAGLPMEMGQPHPELGERVLIPTYAVSKGQLAALTALRYVFSRKYSDIPPIAYKLNSLGLTEEEALLWASSWVFRRDDNIYSDGLVDAGDTPKRDVLCQFNNEEFDGIGIHKTCGESSNKFLMGLEVLGVHRPVLKMGDCYSDHMANYKRFMARYNKAKRNVRNMIEEDIEGFIKKLNIKAND